MHAGEKVKPAQQGSLKPLGLGCIPEWEWKLPSDMEKPNFHGLPAPAPPDPDPTANRVAMVTEYREAQLMPGPGSNPFTSSLITHQVTAASRPWGANTDPASLQIQLSLQSHWAQARLHRDNPTPRTHIRTEIGKCVT